MVASWIATAVFVGTPIVGLFFASRYGWSPKSAALPLVVGAAIHAGCALLARALPQVGLESVVVQAVEQIGIALWTLGLGALVATVIRDKNLLVPVALFLAGLDVFLVFNPEAPTAKLLRQNPEIFRSMAVTVPSARAAEPGKPTGAAVVSQAFVGPADLLFMATFFVALSKFNMRSKETARWLAPVMIGYLLVVLAPWGLNMLPALLPIGATVLIVNRKEFELTRQEKGMAWAVAAIAVGIGGFGIYRHVTYKPAGPAEPSTTVDGPGPPRRGATPPPASDGRSQ